MNISYDRSNIKLAGIGLLPWPRLGPNRWFDDYRIVSYHDWNANVNVPKVHALQSKIGHLLKPKGTQKLIETKSFISLAQEELRDYRFLTYKPVIPPSRLKDRFVSNEPRFDKWENKAYIRNEIGSDVTFPEYRILELGKLNEKANEVQEKLGLNLVVQHESLSGGRGTFIAHATTELCSASSKLLDKTREEDSVVVSEHINGRERSVQCVIAKDQIFVGPLQQQIVRHPLLVNTEDDRSDQFCGGAIAVTESRQAEEQIFKMTQIVGDYMREEGYRGIFGIDYIVEDDSDKVYIIEVNARTTGMTPLLTFGQKKIPFYLLHILELLDEDYEIRPVPTRENQEPSSFLLLHAKADSTNFSREVKSGHYRLDKNGILEYVDGDINWGGSYPILIQVNQTEHVHRAGQRLAQIYFKDNVIDDKGNLSSQAESIVKQLYAMF